MELVFVTKAIRRYWWMLILGAVLGLLAGLLVAPSDSDIYESEALILIAPVNEFGSASTSTDRYVQNQLTLLSSVALAQQVADAVEIDSAAAVRGSTVIEQVGGTDIIRVQVNASSPELARDIANGFVTAYQDAVRRQSQEARQPEIELIDDDLANLEERLAAIDALIQQRMAPFLPGGASANPQVIPTIDEIDPALATQRSVLVSEYTQLLTARNQMDLGTSQQRTGTQILQRAELPTSPSPAGLPLLILAGPVLGVILGAFAAVAVARFSRRVLDLDEISETLQLPVAGSLPRVRALPQPRELVASGIPEVLAPVIHQLCVRAEASGARNDGPLVVVVATTARGAGGTSTATMVARRYAEPGTRVLLLDTDAIDPALSHEFGGAARGIRTLLETELPADTRRAASARSIRPYSDTGYPNLRFAGLDETTEGRSLRRQDVPTLLRAAGEHAQIVVIDVGPIMSAAASLHLAELADAVILVVPAKSQDRGELELIAHQLSNVPTPALPVTTNVGGRWRKRSGGTARSYAERSARQPRERAEASARDVSASVD